MIARDLMTAGPRTIPSTASIADAMRLLHSVGVRHLPVVEGGDLIGILSDRDLKPIEAAPPGITDEEVRAFRRRLSAPVSTIMSAGVASVDPETDVGEIIDMMVDLQIGAVPVVDPHTGDLVGIVSYVDILRELRERLDE